MHFSSKTTSLQAYNLFLYRNALHPEFFRIAGRTRIEYAGYEFEAWIFHGGHVLRFVNGKDCVTELVTDQLEGFPERGLVAAMPCAGEKDHEVEVSDHLVYMTSIQTETLTDHLYLGTYKEMIEHARTTDAIMTTWTDDGGEHNLSVVDMQRYNDEMHVQAYHLRSDCGLVLRNQTIFQIREEAAKMNGRKH